MSHSNRHYAKQILSILRQIDLFGVRVSLNVKDKETYNSLLGAFISIGIYIFSYFSFISMAIDLYQKASPNIVTTINYTPHPEAKDLEYFLTSEDFQFQFLVTNSQGLPVFNFQNATIYTQQFQNCYLVNQQQLNGLITKIEQCINIPVVPCKESNIPDRIKQVNMNFQKYRQKFSLSDDQYQLLNCPEYGAFSKIKLSLKDTQAAANFSFIRIQLFKCVNDTNNPFGKTINQPNIIIVCASSEQIDENLKSGYMAINYFDRLLDQQQQGNPYKTINKFNYFTISATNYHKIVFIYLRHSIMQTIENFWYYLESSFQNHVLQYEYKEEFNDPTLDLKNGEFFRIGFFSDDKTVHYFRSYDNVLNIIGSISGTHQLICYFFSLLIIPINQLLLNREMINSLFNFEQQNIVEKTSRNSVAPKIINQFQINQLKNLHQSISIKDFKLQKVKELRNLIEKKESRLKLSWNEQVTVFCTGLKHRQMQESLQKMIQKMDIVFIIQKLIEFDKLKRLLLEEDQLKLFDYIPKPLVPIHQNQLDESKSTSVRIDYFQKEKPFNIKIVEALTAYKGICKKQTLDSLDQRLINMINEDMKDLFDQYIQSIMEDHQRNSDIRGALSDLSNELRNQESSVLNQLNQ